MIYADACDEFLYDCTAMRSVPKQVKPDGRGAASLPNGIGATVPNAQMQRPGRGTDRVSAFQSLLLAAIRRLGAGFVS